MGRKLSVPESKSSSSQRRERGHPEGWVGASGDVGAFLAFLHIRFSNTYFTSLPYSSLIKWNESRYCTLLERDPTSIVLPSYRRELGMLSA